jgi:hypothetical protein
MTKSTQVTMLRDPAVVFACTFIFPYTAHFVRSLEHARKQCSTLHVHMCTIHVGRPSVISFGETHAHEQNVGVGICAHGTIVTGTTPSIHHVLMSSQTNVSHTPACACTFLHAVVELLPAVFAMHVRCFREGLQIRNQTFACLIIYTCRPYGFSRVLFWWRVWQPANKKATFSFDNYVVFSKFLQEEQV